MRKAFIQEIALHALAGIGFAILVAAANPDVASLGWQAGAILAVAVLVLGLGREAAVGIRNIVGGAALAIDWRPKLGVAVLIPVYGYTNVAAHALAIKWGLAAWLHALIGPS
jgi:hypothetical protein